MLGYLVEEMIRDTFTGRFHLALKVILLHKMDWILGRLQHHHYKLGWATKSFLDVWRPCWTKSMLNTIHSNATLRQRRIMLSCSYTCAACFESVALVEHESKALSSCTVAKWNEQPELCLTSLCVDWRQIVPIHLSNRKDLDMPVVCIGV